MFKLFKKNNVKKVQEIDMWKELKKDLQEIKDLNNAVYNVNINIIRDARNTLVINK